MQKEKQSGMSRERMVNAAWQVFAQFGYQKSSIQDIARTAGVSKAVVFKYFGTKEQLYESVFREAADAIARADAAAKASYKNGESVFSLLRKTVDSRMELFARAPHVYAFSYAAAYDADPVAQRLTRADLQRASAKGGSESAYACLRDGISPEQAKQMIFWISQGFLADQLIKGLMQPETLKQAYMEWVDLMERLMTKQEGEAHET